MRTRLGTSGGGAKTEAKLDSTIRILSHKEAKLKGERRGAACRRLCSLCWLGRAGVDVLWCCFAARRQVRAGLWSA